MSELCTGFLEDVLLIIVSVAAGLLFGRSTSHLEDYVQGYEQGMADATEKLIPRQDRDEKGW